MMNYLILNRWNISIFLFLWPSMSLLNSCGSYQYQEFVSVAPSNQIPQGTKYIIVTENLDSVKNAFKNKGIMIKSMEGGFETEELLLDEGTRAMYKIHEFDQQNQGFANPVPALLQVGAQNHVFHRCPR
jgi:hypothetical protein